MNTEDIIRMAQQAGMREGESSDWTAADAALTYSECVYTENLERFANLVAAAEREKVAVWMMQRGYATGHGDTIEDLLVALDIQIVENWTRALVNGVQGEREACAKVCDDMHLYTGFDCAEAIRARGQG